MSNTKGYRIYVEKYQNQSCQELANLISVVVVNLVDTTSFFYYSHIICT